MIREVTNASRNQSRILQFQLSRQGDVVAEEERDVEEEKDVEEAGGEVHLLLLK